MRDMKESLASLVKVNGMRKRKARSRYEISSLPEKKNSPKRINRTTKNSFWQRWNWDEG